MDHHMDDAYMAAASGVGPAPCADGPGTPATEPCGTLSESTGGGDDSCQHGPSHARYIISG